MAEAIVEPIVEPITEKIEPPAPIVEEPAAAEPKKKAGRPAGAKDKAPRTRKKIVIVEEPLQPPPPEAPAPPVEPAPKPAKPAKAAPLKTLPRLDVSFEPEAEIEEPPSPRTVMRSASMSILQLRSLTERAKKTHLQEAYTKNLRSL